MEDFKNQLLDFTPGTTFDVFIARYFPEKKYTAQYIEKKMYLQAATPMEVLSHTPKLVALNTEDFNIYIRPQNYNSSHLVVLDDFHTGVEQRSLAYEIENFGLSPQDFCLSFSLLTSVVPKEKIIRGQKYNYQLGVEINPLLPVAYKSKLLTYLCEQLTCDPQHAQIQKYLRASGFQNKKYWPQENQLDPLEQKNTLISYKKYEVKFQEVITPPEPDKKEPTPIAPKVEIASASTSSSLLKKLKSFM